MRDEEAERQAPDRRRGHQHRDERPDAPQRVVGATAHGRGVAPDRRAPQAGGREPGDGACAAETADLQRDPATERVADDVGPVEPEPVQQPDDGLRERGRRRYGVTGQRGGAAEARQVDGDHVVPALELSQHGLPDAQLAADAVQEHERLAGPGASQVQADDEILGGAPEHAHPVPRTPRRDHALGAFTGGP